MAKFHNSRDGLIEILSGSDLSCRDTNAFSLRFGASVDARLRLDLIIHHQKDAPLGTGFRSNVFPARQGDNDIYRAPADVNHDDELGPDCTINGVPCSASPRSSTA